MPCRPEEEFAQGSDDSDADLCRTPRRKRVIQPEPSDAGESNSDSNFDAEIQSKKVTGKGSRPWKIKEFVHYQSQRQTAVSHAE
jgi:hypothetical protein